MIKATANPYLDIRNPHNDGNFPIQIRITYNRQSKYYTTPFSLSKEDYPKIWGQKPRQEFKQIHSDLKALLDKADEVINQLGEKFTFKAFEAKFLKARSKWNDVFTSIEDYAKALRDEGRINTAVACECCHESLKKFTERDKLSFAALDVSLLKKYEAWMLGNGRSVSTVGIYLRALRSVYNRAIREKLVNHDLYPFGERLYEIPTSQNIKKALDREQIKMILDYIPQDEGEAKAKDFWIFSYLANGMNIKDIALLRYKDIKGNSIEFVRAKTKRSMREVKPIEVPVNDRMKEIIRRWGNTFNPDNYIFPIIEHGSDAERETVLIKNFTYVINKFLHRIGQALGFPMKLTSYSARHSYATRLQNAGIPVAFIQKSLGHSSVQVTENYLGSFEKGTLIETQKILTDLDK